MSDQKPEDTAFNLRFRAAFQDQVARTADSEGTRQFAAAFAKQLRVQADLIEQGVPVDRVMRPQPNIGKAG